MCVENTDIILDLFKTVHSIETSTLYEYGLVSGMTSLGEISSLSKPKEGAVLLLQLMFVKSQTKDRVPIYFNCSGVCNNRRTSTTKPMVLHVQPLLLAQM